MGPGFEADDCQCYTEKECREKGAFGTIKATSILKMVFEN